MTRFRKKETDPDTARALDVERSTVSPDDALQKVRPVFRVASPGRLSSRYLRMMEESVTDEDWREIVEAAVEQAKQGNHRARIWLGTYLLPPPDQKIDGHLVGWSPHEWFQQLQAWDAGLTEEVPEGKMPWDSQKPLEPLEADSDPENGPS